MVDQPVVVLQGLDTSMPVEQGIEVPKITLEDRIPQRAVLRVPLPVEQLVEVPTPPGYALAVVAVQTLEWTEARALFEQLAARPGRIQILATATVAEAVVDVLAIISDKLQQSFVEFVEVPQLQFIDIVVGFVVRRDRAHSANCADDRMVQFLDWDTPVVVQRLGRMVQTVQSGGVAGAVPARLWTSLRSCRTSRSSRRSREVPQIQFITRAGL